MTHLRIIAYVFGAAIVSMASFGAATMVSAPAPAFEPAPVEVVRTEPVLDRADYDRRMRRLAHLEEAPSSEQGIVADSESGDAGTETAEDASPEPPLWPVIDAPYPKAGAILPFNRIVAYYGNFYTTRMGILNEFPEDVVLAKWEEEAKKWEAADPETPVIKAVDYIAVTAQASPGKDGMYRARMPDDQIEHAIDLAERIEGIVILEVQPGFSPVMTEVRALGEWLAHPKVHLALDPEFAMIRRGRPPGKVVGTIDAWEVNAAAEFLRDLVNEHDLPPKILVVHRYTEAMLTNATDIRPLPEVQVIVDMDGWGPPAQKFGTYNHYIAPFPVQFTGFKLFYKNDIWTGVPMLAPEQVLELTPAPIFIQYQ